MRVLVLAAVGCFAALPVRAEEPRLRLPYFDWGACPLERCMYQAWQAVRPTTVWRQRNHASPVAFRVAKGEWVEAVTGVVITYKPGLSKVLAPMTLGQHPDPSVAVVPGDILLTLHYAGEGYDLFWFKGRTYADQIASDKPDPDPPDPTLTVQVLSRPRSIWWVKVSNKKNEVGWTDHAHNFRNVSLSE